MSKVVLDTSALLAYLFEEEGADKVAPILEEGRGVIGSANYADQIGLWLRRQYIRMPLRRETVAAEFPHVMTLKAGA